MYLIHVVEWMRHRQRPKRSPNVVDDRVEERHVGIAYKGQYLSIGLALLGQYSSLYKACYDRDEMTSGIALEYRVLGVTVIPDFDNAIAEGVGIEFLDEDSVVRLNDKLAEIKKQLREKVQS